MMAAQQSPQRIWASAQSRDWGNCGNIELPVAMWAGRGKGATGWSAKSPSMGKTKYLQVGCIENS